MRIKQPGADVHVVHVDLGEGDLADIRQPVRKRHFAGLAADAPMAFQQGLASFRRLDRHTRPALGVFALHIPEQDFGRMRGEGAVQRVFAA